MSLKAARLLQEALELGASGKNLVNNLLRQIPAGRGFSGGPGPVIPRGGFDPRAASLGQIPDKIRKTRIGRGLDGGPAPVIPEGGIDPRAASLGQIPDRIRKTSTGAGFRGRLPDDWPTIGPNLPPGTTVPRAPLGGGNNPIVGPRVINPQGFGLPKITAGGLLNTGMTGLGAYGVVDKLRKGNTRGAAADALLMAPGKLLAGAAGLFGVTEGLFPRSAADGTMAAAPKLTAAQIKKANEARKKQGLSPLEDAAAEAVDPLAMRERYGGSGDMDAGDSATYTPQDGYVFESDVVPPAPMLPPPPSNNLPSSPEQSMMDPYAYNLAVYGQGRKLATTQSEMDAVRDLGLAINRRLYPKLNKTQNANPLMASMFPERVNDTLQGNIQSRGTTLPGSMIEADSGSELATAQVQDTPYQAEFRRGAQEASIADATNMLEQLIGQAEVDAIRRRMGM